MTIDANKVRRFLKDFDFKTLFIDELGWDRCNNQIDILIDGNAFNLSAVAEKRGMAAFICSPLPNGQIPDYAKRLKIERQTAKSVHEHIIIYTDANRTSQIWQWVRREAGKPTACREHPYHINQPGDSLIQKLQEIAFGLEEEELLTIVEVSGRARSAFDIERITKRFYERFKAEHDGFLKFIHGIPDDELQRWYASVMLNRLMFIYFIQKKGFLDNNHDYLKAKLIYSKQHGKDHFYKKFLCPLFFEGFAKKENERTAEINKLLGKIPYLNGGLFLKHQIEELRGKHIQIADTAFEKLFDFFDQYQWHLDERPLKKDNEINPDVLGYIFEKYINQKQMGAYYTKEDITEYISKNTVIPFLFDTAKQKCRIAFELETKLPPPLTGGGKGEGEKRFIDDASIWRLLQSDPDRYIYDAVKIGVIADNGNVMPESVLPDFVQKGMYDPKERLFDKRYNLGEADLRDVSGEKLTLPTETWREYAERRKRCLELRGRLVNGEIRDINDLITYNRNIRQFAQDVIENSEGPELLRAFYHAIESVTVLDPTCGSGAFLFAALNILEPLYEACLDRMQVFIEELERSGEKRRSDKYSDFKKILKRVEEHPNLKYFIYKSIIVNNLYGVDIMEEAIEICKLRLFLKLVAQIDSIEHIEPLPDIDFNIRAGNTLVGFATYEEVKQAVTSKFDFENTMERIEKQAEEIDRLFKLFHQQQTEIGGEVAPEDKQELRKRLKALEDELNQYLAREYGVDIAKGKQSTSPPLKKGDTGGFEQWHKTHHPFHWFIEFYGILKNGGFDVIIGNPPYVEYSKVKGEYTIKGYKTESCGNLYANVMERSIELLKNSGKFGMIMPIAVGSTDRMKQVRELFENKSSDIFYSNFADRPSCLFSGVHQILSIILSERGQLPNNSNSNLYTTRFYHWYSIDRAVLFDSIQYINATNYARDKAWPKIGSEIQIRILQNVRNNKKRLSDYFQNTKSKYPLWVCGGTGGYWLRAFPFLQTSPKYKVKHVLNYDEQLIICGILNSTLFYLFWRIFSNCRDLMINDIEKFKYIPDESKKELALTSKQQIEAISKTKETREGKMTYDQYRPSQVKEQIDEIDRVLAQHYGFTDEELDFIINYDIKYRMGRESGEEE